MCNLRVFFGVSALGSLTKYIYLILFSKFQHKVTCYVSLTINVTIQVVNDLQLKLKRCLLREYRIVLTNNQTQSTSVAGKSNI